MESLDRLKLMPPGLRSALTFDSEGKFKGWKDQIKIYNPPYPIESGGYYGFRVPGSDVVRYLTDYKMLYPYDMFEELPKGKRVLELVHVDAKNMNSTNTYVDFYKRYPTYKGPAELLETIEPSDRNHCDDCLKHFQEDYEGEFGESYCRCPPDPSLYPPYEPSFPPYTPRGDESDDIPF
jgi:hypothetical protein